MTHNSLENYYRTNFMMTFYHHYALNDVENMLPYELNIYSDMIKEALNSKK